MDIDKSQDRLMLYDLECGHCGSAFGLDGPPPRAVKCPVCGGALTVAVAVPRHPQPTPERAPVPAPQVVPPVPAERPVGAPPATDERPRPPSEPWAEAHAGLNLARLSVLVMAPLSALMLAAGSFVNPFVPPIERGPGEDLLWGLMFAHLALAAAHFVGQIRCLKVPESHARQTAEASYFLLFLGAVLFTVCLRVHPTDAALAMLVGLGLSFVAFVVWVVFLLQLGARLGADDLRGAARAFLMNFAFGSAKAAVLLAAADVAERAGLPGVVFRLAAGAIVLFLLWRYSALLRTAVRAVTTRAPVTPGA